MKNNQNKHIQHQSHSLHDIELDENGVVDKYKEFHEIDFSNSFVKLEKPDYEIRANEDKKEDHMKGTREKRVASYVSKLTSGYDAKVQNDYEAGNTNGQAGKAETEEVTKSPNWNKDKRDAVGRAASTMLKRVASRLTKLADIYESGEEIDDLENSADEEFEQLEVEAACGSKHGNDDNDTDDVDEECVEGKIATDKEAVHPIDHNEKNDNPKANMSSQTGDDEWVDIGKGTFNDKRDEVGRANETAQ